MSLTLIQLATDNFTRADANPISGSWDTVGGAAAWQIKSNMAESTVIGINANLSISTAVVWPADQYSEVTVGVSPINTDLGGPAVRFAAGSKNGYILFYQGGSGPITVQTVITPGSGTTIASSGTLNVSIGDVLRLVVIGNQLSAYQNGVEIIAPFTDNTFATGSPGLSSYIQTGTTGNIRFSLWSGGSASITPPPPSPASISPTSDEQGFTGNVTVTGTAFDSSGTSTLSFSGTDVTVNSYGTRNATTITASITITSGAALTARDVVITNVDSQTGTLVAAFTVTSGAPSPASVSPTSAEQGYIGNITIAGTNFSTGTLSFSGTGITVNSYSVQNTTTITANITIANNATLSARDVVITNLDTQTGTLTASFTVTSGAPLPASISPTSDEQGFTGNVVVTGTNFDSGGTSTLSFSGAGVTVNSYGTRNTTNLTANITIAPSAALTARDVIVTNVDTQTGTLAAAFTITPSPVIISVSRLSGSVGMSITITGTSFGATQGTSTVTFNGVTATTTSWSNTSIVVTVPVGATTGNIVVRVSGVDSNGSLFTITIPTRPPAFIPLPFSKRLTASAAVFACIGITSPQGAPRLTSNVPILVALQLEYSQLINIYPVLIHQDTANNRADLYAAIAKATTTVENLNTTIESMMAVGDAGFQLRDMQIVVANALTALHNVEIDE
jgi:hypothetical protein